MRKERKIINTNIRLNLCDEQDRQAWEYLQTMDREKYKSYTRAVVAVSYTHLDVYKRQGGNWTWRMKKGAFTPEIQKRCRQMNRLYGRRNSY